MVAPILIVDHRGVRIVRLDVRERMRLQEPFLVLGGEAEHRQHLVAAAGLIDHPAPGVTGGQRAQRIRARHVEREQPTVVLQRRVLVAAAILVQRRQGLARRQLIGIERDDLFERLDGADRVALARQLAQALPERRALASGFRVGSRRRQAGQRARQLVGQPEPLGQAIGEPAQRQQRRLVLRILHQRLFEQVRRPADVAPFGHQQGGFAAPLGALLGILDQLDQ